MTTVVVRSGEPITTVGVEISNDNGVAVGVVEETIKRRFIVVRVARVDRRKVNIVDGESEVAKMDLYSLYLQVWVGVESVGIDRREFDRVVNKKSKTAAISRTITPKQCVIRKRRTWIR